MKIATDHTELPPLSREAFYASFCYLQDLYDRCHSSHIFCHDAEQRKRIDEKGRKVVEMRKKLSQRLAEVR